MYHAKKAGVFALHEVLQGGPILAIAIFVVCTDVHRMKADIALGNYILKDLDANTLIIAL
jgi:hypothetical protein